MYWWNCSYTYEERFVSMNAFYMLMAMSVIHNSTSNIKPQSSTPITTKTWKYWIAPVVFAIIWLIIGQSRTHESTWLRYAFNWTWVVFINGGIHLGLYQIKKDNGGGATYATSELLKYYTFWTYIVNFLLVVRVL